LTRIKSNAFSNSALNSIIIPRHAQILCSFCFAFYESLSSISFETDSELTRIEANASLNSRSIQSQFLVTFKFVVHFVLHIADHFHQFHSKQIPSWSTSRLGPLPRQISTVLFSRERSRSLLPTPFHPIVQ
jgi:hypothetical protein